MACQVTRILLVEDNQADADLIRERLDACGDVPPFELEHVHSMEAALHRLARGHVNLVLLDPGLPDSHGLNTIWEIGNGAGAVPLVVISGVTDPEFRRRAFDAKVMDYIPKDSLDGPQLAALIRSARAQAHGAAPDDGAAAGHVLIFERDELTFHVSETIIQLLGYETTRGTSPAHVIEQARLGAADLVLIGLGTDIDERRLPDKVAAVTAVPTIVLYPPSYHEAVTCTSDTRQWLPKPLRGAALRRAVDSLVGIRHDPRHAALSGALSGALSARVA